MDFLLFSSMYRFILPASVPVSVSGSRARCGIASRVARTLSPVSSRRRSRAVASRDVTRRCSDATSRQGQPARLWSLGNPFSPYCRAAVFLPHPLSHFISQPRALLYRVHVPFLNELSPLSPPPPPPLSLPPPPPPPASCHSPPRSPYGAIVATLPFSMT